MCVDRAGCVGADGETHQGTFDLAFFRIIPNLNILAPKDFKELEDMLEFAVNLNEPVVIRYPRGGEEKIKFEKHNKIEKGKCEILEEGKDISIIAIGKMVARAMEIAQELKQKIDIEVINSRFLKPLDKEEILKSINKTKKVITIEDGNMLGGLATSIKELIVEEKIENITLKSFAYPDEFIKHGKVEEIEKIYGLDKENIKNEINKMITINNK